MDGPLIANYASSKDGSMESLELVDLRNPTQDMQRFLSQWRRWYWLSCNTTCMARYICMFMYVHIYVCIWKNGTMWEFYSIWYSHSSMRGSSPLPVVVTGPMDWGKLEWMMVTTDDDFDHIWWLTIRIDEKWLQVWCLCQAHLQGSHSYCQCRWPVSSISLTFL